MKNNFHNKLRNTILFRIFTVVIVSSASLILFLFALWGILKELPDKTYAHIHLVITLIILVVAGTMVISYIIRRILKPLTLLSDSAEKIGKGDLDLNIPVKSNDELGRLAISFNKMTVDLKNMLKAREQLMLDVSHELRTPITRAKLALELMPDNPHKESLAGDLKDMEVMITEILESERLKNGTIQIQKHKVQLKKMLQNLLNHYQRENSRIKLLPVSSKLSIDADEAKIMTVLKNILDNSLKYSPAGAKPVEISVILKDQYNIIQIEDFGQGIPEESMPFIFEPFYRADQSRSRKTGGYGLGLHLCKRIMDMHGAQIKLANKPIGQGIIASLYFKEIENTGETEAK